MAKIYYLAEQKLIRSLPRPERLSLHFNPQDSRIESEIKKIKLRSLAFRALTKHCFGSPDYLDIPKHEYFRRAQVYFTLLSKYPELSLANTLWNASTKEFPLGLSGLEIQSGDSAKTAAAKREAAYLFIATVYDDLFHHKPLYYPAITRLSHSMPRTIASLHQLFDPALMVLKNHSARLSERPGELALKKALEQHLFKPSLPFDVKLPE